MDKEKIEEILNCKNCKKQLFVGGVKCPPTCADYNDLMQMAQWKDEQFKAEKQALIEKACEFLYKYNQKQVQKHGAKATLGCVKYTINVEDFKKAMKGGEE